MSNVQRLFAATDNFKHRLLLQTFYSAGLRVSKLVRLKPHHIESDPDRMMLRVDQGKGKKDRYTLQRFLNHASLKSTIIYLHLLPERLQQCKSPLDTLYEEDA